MSASVVTAEVVSWCREYAEKIARGEAERFHAVLCDPPAGIEFMGRAWDSFKERADHPRSGDQTEEWDVNPGTPFARSATPRFKGKARVKSPSWEQPFTEHGYARGGWRLPAPTIGQSAANPMCRACHKHKRRSVRHVACSCERPDFDERDRVRSIRENFVASMTACFSAARACLLPGAHGFVWALPRTAHWTMTALDDAGFEVRDVVTHHFGSGFPKSLNVGKAIDKARIDDVRPVCRFVRAAMERVGMSAAEIAAAFEFHPRMIEHWAARDTDSQPTCPTVEQWKRLRGLLGFGAQMDAEVERLNCRKGELGDAWKDAPIRGEYSTDTPGLVGRRFTVRDRLIRAPATSDAAAFADHGTALKPATEFWILVRNPLVGTVASNCQKHGAGALNIDAARIAGPKPVRENTDGDEGMFGLGSRRVLREDGSDATSRPGYDGGFTKGGRRILSNHTRSATAAKSKGIYADSPAQATHQTEGQKIGRWPANLALSHCSPDERGEGGCVRVGTRHVATSAGVRGGDSNGSGIYGKAFPRGDGRAVGYGDADGCEEVESWRCVEGCAVAELNRQSGTLKSGDGPNFVNASSKDAGYRPVAFGASSLARGHQNIVYGDEGGASRFFHNSGWDAEVYERIHAEAPTGSALCARCGLPTSARTDTLSACKTADGADATTPRSGAVSASAATDVLLSPRHNDEAMSAPLKLSASAADDGLLTTLATSASTAPESAGAKIVEPLDLPAAYADGPCDSCGTDGAQSDAPTRHVQSNDQAPSPQSTDAHNERIRFRSHASGVERQDATDTTRTTPNRSESCGCAALAIDASMAVEEALAGAPPFLYCAKSSRSERDAGLDAPVGTRETPMAGRGQGGLRCRACGKWKVSGSPCECAEPDLETVAFDRPAILNGHPTCKPIALTTWLATLLLPPPHVAPRRILCPFAGSGGEVIGAMLAGFEEVVGIEMSEEYAAIARARIAFWERHQHDDIGEAVAAWQRSHGEAVAAKARGQMSFMDAFGAQEEKP